MSLKEQSRNDMGEEPEGLSDTPRGKFILDAIVQAQKKWHELKEKNETKDQVIPVCHLEMDEFAKYAQLFPRYCIFSYETIFMKDVELAYSHHEIPCEYIKFYLRELFNGDVYIYNGTPCQIRYGFKVADIIVRPLCRQGESNSFSIHDHVVTYPTAVVEFSNLNESLNELKIELMNWISPPTTVMISMGFKIKRHQPGCYSIDFLIAFRNLNRIFEYQIGAVDHDGNPIDQSKLDYVPIPVALIFDGFPIPDSHLQREFFEMNLTMLSSYIQDGLRIADTIEILP